MMKKMVQFTILPLLFLLVCSGQVLSFTDPAGLYSTTIPESWIYQGQRSSEQISVFYGEGDYDLLYFQDLGVIADNTLESFLQRSLDLYGGPGGLQEFQLELPPHPIQVAGEQGLACGYTYKEQGGNRLWEYRIFLLLPQQRGFSLTLGGGGPWVDREYPILEEILSQWRWLF